MIELSLPAPRGYAGHRLVIVELDFEVDEPYEAEPAEPVSGKELILRQLRKIPVGEPFSALDFVGCKFVTQTLVRMVKRGEGIRFRPERIKLAGGGTPLLVYERVQ